MSDENTDLKKAKILEQKHKFAQQRVSVTWSAVAKATETKSEETPPTLKPPTTSPLTANIWPTQTTSNIDFHAKNLENGDFAGENLQNANLASANLKGINLAGANLRGVDFSGADLTGANLEGADLTGANLSGAKLIGANLKKTILKESKLSGADLTDAIFLEIDIDNLSLEELQELVEYLATYYPHKLNLTKFDLKLLDLSKIDLKNVSLRGVDFTGVDFTGINLLELDLSECIITPEQIAQALGRTPSPEELKKILAPKPKKKGKAFFIDMTDFFFDNGIPAGVWDTRRGKGTTFEQIFNAVKRFTNAFKRDEKTEEKTKEPEKATLPSSNDDLRKIIEENKKNVLEEKKKEYLSKQPTQQKPLEKPRQPIKQHILDNALIRQRGDNSRG